ncbi:unnamed protein product [Lactuca saligna]|uniref:Uncharacterized protein n=1 Tax=Lactuca saligna TaxID=75948 RepID=A0AA36A3U5_LACSI|nr:unnamed protein product [Lactuca saligna]
MNQSTDLLVADTTAPSFPHQQAWEWLKENVKWEFIAKAGEESQPPSSKRTKTSSSNAYTSSSDPKYPPDSRLVLKTHHLREKEKERNQHRHHHQKMKCLILSNKLPTSRLQPKQRRNRDNDTGNKNCTFSKLINNEKLNYWIKR